MAEVRVRTDTSRPNVRKTGVRTIILKPMYITIRQFFRSLVRPSTLMYPKEKMEDMDQIKPQHRFGVEGSWEFFRGAHALDEDLCVSCGVCALTCPNAAIEMVYYKGRKLPQLDQGRCMFCTLCVEACPKAALLMTSEYELAQESRDKLIDTPGRLIWRKERGRRPLFPARPPKYPIIDMETCIGCGMCAKNCPVAALEMKETGEPVEEGKKPKKKPAFDRSKCVSCGICESKCPKDCIQMRGDET